jgi:hypothetical protein
MGCWRRLGRVLSLIVAEVGAAKMPIGSRKTGQNMRQACRETNVRRRLTYRN